VMPGTDCKVAVWWMNWWMVKVKVTVIVSRKVNIK
jgi:hypothetical protein